MNYCFPLFPKEKYILKDDTLIIMDAPHVEPIPQPIQQPIPEYYKSPEHAAKIRQWMAGSHGKVTQLDENEKVIKEWDTVAKAAASLVTITQQPYRDEAIANHVRNIRSVGGIRYPQRAYGYFWKCENLNQYPLTNGKRKRVEENEDDEESSDDEENSEDDEENLEGEKWKRIRNLRDDTKTKYRYFVSNKGRVKREGCVPTYGTKRTDRSLSTMICFRNGTKREYLIHRLVMYAFGRMDRRSHICHWDGNKSNNERSNLRYNARSIEKPETSQYTVTHVGINGKICEYDSVSEAARQLGLTYHIVMRICRQYHCVGEPDLWFSYKWDNLSKEAQNKYIEWDIKRVNTQ